MSPHEQSEMGKHRLARRLLFVIWIFAPLGLILPDQPNRAVRTRMLRGVGGAPCEGRPYPYVCRARHVF